MAVLCWSLPTITQTSREGAVSPPSCPSPATPSNPSGPSQNHGQAGFPVFHRSSPIAICFTLGRAHMGFSRGTSGREPSCQCRRHKTRGFNPWVGKIPWRRAWQPTPVSLPRESHGQRSLVGYSPGGHRSQTRLSTCAQQRTVLFVEGFPGLHS